MVTDQYVSDHNGVTHLYLRQQFGGIEVYNADINVNLTSDGEIINVNNRFVPNLEIEISQSEPQISAETAVKQAADHLNLRAPAQLTVTQSPQGQDARVVFEGDGISLDPIPAKLMYFPTTGRATRLVWNTALRLPDRKRWLELNIDAENGRILSESNWIADAGYRVFPLPLESPNDGGRALETDPHDTTASPHGWHDSNGVSGPEFTDTRGNNVDAQEDTDGNNSGGFRPNGGSGLTFDFPLDFGKQPEANQSASLTNLFYWNNILHDVHYHYGFDEQAGNFQRNNYGNGGVPNDQVKADMLDGSGYNNANFGTPPDGQNPRMQMFVWSGPPGNLTVNSPVTIAGTYEMSGATFGTALSSPLSANLVLVNDGSANPTLACGPLVNAAEMAGNIALADRGACNFADKAYYAQMAGARGLVVINNVPGGGTFTMSGWDPYIYIPVFMVSYEEGQLLKTGISQSAVNVTLPPRINRDSALDNGVIIHEFGHGVSNRLTGGPSNSSALSAVQSRGMGEGWSDWWALVFTANASDTATTSRGIGTYVLGEGANGPGIRPAPYSTDLAVNSLTYGDVLDPYLTIPHGIGTIWCTALWEVYWNLVSAHGFDPDLYHGTGGNNLAMQLVIDGLKLQPSNPTYLDARDAILLADQVNNAGANQDLLWAAFAKRGMGVSAYDGGSASSLDVLEAFDTPNSLLLTPGPDYIYEVPRRAGASSVSGWQYYTLKNTGVAPLNWTAAAPSNWLDLDVESGTLAPGESVDVQAYLTNQLRVMGAGTYFDTVTFTNTTDGVSQQRRAHLTLSLLMYGIDSHYQEILSSEKPWFFETTISKDGEDAAQSGDVDDDETSWMETEVIGPDTVVFWWKVSSEAGYDFLNLYVDDVLIDSISGEVDWTKVALEIPAGHHSIRWEYSKDYSLDGGADAGWVDLFDRSDGQKPVITSDLLADGLTGIPFHYQIAATSSPSSFSSGALPAGLSFNSNTGIISGTPTVAGTYPVSITAQNALGSTTETLVIEVRDVASFPFSEDFEGGSLGSVWLAGNTNVGRVYPAQNYGPRGSWHLIMDTADNRSSRGELTMAMNLDGQSDVLLSFWAKEFNDESNGPPAIPFTGHADFDGVAISEDGITWYEVFPLRGALRGTYTQFHVDLDAAIRNYGLNYNAAFRIRFTHYGTRGLPEDGIALDDISVQSIPLRTTLASAPGSSPNAVVFSGVANPGAVIHLVSNLDGVIGTTTADGNGIWSISAAGLTAGTHRVIASVSGIPRASTVITAANPPPGEPTYELIPFGSLWHYLDDGSDQYSTTPPFYSESYSDYSWASGNARLGYGG
ncbi:MAG: M36 family metallopeptidase, partial [Verrucomicrobiae bacterium]|nr:M36 family metallopeptidase [Verrucomicrobiae bacterium]